jgi:hypothetical protein
MGEDVVEPASPDASARAQRTRLGTLIALALLALTVASGRTIALLQGSQGVGGNTFTTASCFQARVNSFQTGTGASIANGTLTVPIASVDPAKSFLLFNTRHDSNRPVGSVLRGRLATSTSLEFVRVTDEPVPVTITIQWYVVEYECGVSVQRGAVAQTATLIDVPITPLGGLRRAFVTWSKSPNSTDLTWDQDDPVFANLTSTSNLRLRVNTANANHVIWWQVVEFTDPSDISVQRGNTSLLGTALSTTVTLGTAVDLAKSFVLVTYRSAGTGPDIGARMLRARLTGPTTVVIDRFTSGTPDDITQINWQVVELRDGSSVQGGTASVPAGTASAAIPLSPIDLGRATGFLSVQSGGGQNAGSSPYVADDVLGVGSFTATLAPATLTLDRANTAAAADVGWFVVEWGPP